MLLRCRTRPVLIFLVLVLTGCSQFSDSRPASRDSRGRGARESTEAVPVSTAVVIERTMPLDLPAVGTAEAISSVQIRSQVTGQLGAMHFAEGQDVTKGQLLFELDPRPFQLALAQAEAVLAKDVAQNANAQTEAARYKALLDQGLIAREQYDSYTANAAAAQATTGADQAAVDTARLNLQFTRITAPISGRAGALTAHVGDLVRANDTAPLVVINQMSPINVTFAVPGRLLDDIRRYQAAAPLQVAAVSGDSNTRRPSGRVTFIDNAVDPTTGTIKLKALFDNASRDLWPGEFVNVNLQLTTDPHAIVTPASAVQASQNGPYVYVVRGDRTVDMRPVNVARTAGAETVIASGLKPGETVVTDGQLRLTPGARVTIRESPVGTTGATR
jgi:multidrug efflux system membrane fusion protein